MKTGIELGFDVLSELFDRVPFLGKLKGYRTAIGLIALGVLKIMELQGVDGGVWDKLELGFFVWTGLALNSKGR